MANKYDLATFEGRTAFDAMVEIFIQMDQDIADYEPAIYAEEVFGNLNLTTDVNDEDADWVDDLDEAKARVFAVVEKTLKDEQEWRTATEAENAKADAEEEQTNQRLHLLETAHGTRYWRFNHYDSDDSRGENHRASLFCSEEDAEQNGDLWMTGVPLAEVARAMDQYEDGMDDWDFAASEKWLSENQGANPGGHNGAADLFDMPLPNGFEAFFSDELKGAEWGMAHGDWKIGKTGYRVAVDLAVIY